MTDPATVYQVDIGQMARRLDVSERELAQKIARPQRAPRAPRERGPRGPRRHFDYGGPETPIPLLGELGAGRPALGMSAPSAVPPPASVLTKPPPPPAAPSSGSPRLQRTPSAPLPQSPEREGNKNEPQWNPDGQSNGSPNPSAPASHRRVDSHQSSSNTDPFPPNFSSSNFMRDPLFSSNSNSANSFMLSDRNKRFRRIKSVDALPVTMDSQQSMASLRISEYDSRSQYSLADPGETSPQSHTSGGQRTSGRQMLFLHGAANADFYSPEAIKGSLATSAPAAPLSDYPEGSVEVPRVLPLPPGADGERKPLLSTSARSCGSSNNPTAPHICVSVVGMERQHTAEFVENEYVEVDRHHSGSPQHPHNQHQTPFLVSAEGDDVTRPHHHHDDDDEHNHSDAATTDDDGHRVSILNGHKDRRRSSTRRSVRFTRESIKRVELVHNDAQLLMRVQYNRPVWAYFFGLVAYFSFAMAWSLISYLAFPSDLPQEDIMKSFAKFSFMTFIGAAVFISFLAFLCWPRSRRDMVNIKKKHLRNTFLLCVGSYAIARTLFVCAMMFTISSASVANFVSLPVIFIFGYLCVIERKFTVLDLVGVVLVFAANVVLFAGEIQVNRAASLVNRYIGCGVCLFASAMEAVYRVQLRRSMLHFSSRLVVPSCLGCLAVLLAILTAAVGGFTAVTGRTEEHHHFFYANPGDTARLVIASICMVLTIGGQQIVSLYFDPVSSAAGMCISAPLALMFFVTFHLPAVEPVYRYVGMGSLLTGCIIVLVAGYIHRSRVELPINVALFGKPSASVESTVDDLVESGGSITQSGHVVPVAYGAATNRLDSDVAVAEGNRLGESTPPPPAQQRRGSERDPLLQRTSSMSDRKKPRKHSYHGRELSSPTKAGAPGIPILKGHGRSNSSGGNLVSPSESELET